MSLDKPPFSERENDVIQLLTQGKSNKQIALELGISTRTVEFHLSNIYSKLEVNSRSEAILKLTAAHLRESTVGGLVKFTAELSGDLTENSPNSIFRRIILKKSIHLFVGIFAAAFFIFLVLIRPAVSGKEPEPSAQVLPATSTVLVTSVSPPSSTPPPAEKSPVPLQTKQPPQVVIPPHTVNGYTASIESYYIDSSHIIFLVRLTGGEISFGTPLFFSRIGTFDVYDEFGTVINTSGSSGPAVDPALYQFEFVPINLLKGNRIKGQFAFDVNNAPDYETILAKFRFDFDLPINPDIRFNPKQTTFANNLDILLDSVTVAPAFTQIYLCFPPIFYAPWTIGSQTVLQIDGQKAYPLYFRELFNSDTSGDRRAGSEPYWTPAIKNGRCIKSLFPIGSDHPTSLTLLIPQLEKINGDLLMNNQFSNHYPGLSPKEAYYKALEEQGDVYKGPWTFSVDLAR